MKIIILLIVIVDIVPSCFAIKTINIDSDFRQWWNGSVNNDLEYLIEYNIEKGKQPRVIVQSAEANASRPLVVVGRRDDQVISWRVPLIVESHGEHVALSRTARMLCPHQGNVYNRNPSKLYISLTTPSTTNVSFNVMTEHVDTFIATSIVYKIRVTPSEPRFYFYNFTRENVEDERVLVKVESDDEICAVFSIQNASCPIFDLNADITHGDYWSTITRKGGITVTREKFPNGFFVVFVPKGDDTDCLETSKPLAFSREKSLSFIITPYITYRDYITAIIITLIAFGAILIGWLMGTDHSCLPLTMDYVNGSQIMENTTDSLEICNEKLSFGIMEYTFLSEIVYDRKMIFNKPVLFLSDLARKDPRILRKNSNLYLWYVITVALFYGFPIVHLVITYQKLVNDSGSQDFCYYNSLCALPLGFLNDFNHVFSNIGYIVFGLLFIEFVRRRERLHNDMTFEKFYGIPQHYGLFYAMGVALFMEGILSAAYHICPNRSNFQFDSSFIYVLNVLCVVKLYQTRHPDVNASAYTTFAVLGIAMLLGIISVMGTSMYFWIVFIALHLTSCFLLTVQVYYFGSWKIEKETLKRIWKEFRWNSLKLPTPTYKSRMVLVIIGNVHNWILAFMCVRYEFEFSSYLQLLLLTNTLIYFFFYVTMKVLHGEKLNNPSMIYACLSIVFFLFSFYFLGNSSNNWNMTPAKSKELNQECNLWGFYDYHDVWHFMSALAMFLNFMMLFTLDDDLSHTPRSKIAVF